MVNTSSFNKFRDQIVNYRKQGDSIIFPARIVYHWDESIIEEELEVTLTKAGEIIICEGKMIYTPFRFLKFELRYPNFHKLKITEEGYLKISGRQGSIGKYDITIIPL
jgi:hypothetical protein